MSTGTKGGTMKEEGKKYELLEVSPSSNLYRIRALRDFGDVHAGDLGGYVQSESNLSHEELCWVYDNAVVKDNAYIGECAMLRDNAIVSGNARVVGYCTVSDDAVIKDKVYISGTMVISGSSVLEGEIQIHGKGILNDIKTYD